MTGRMEITSMFNYTMHRVYLGNRLIEARESRTRRYVAATIVRFKLDYLRENAVKDFEKYSRFRTEKNEPWVFAYHLEPKQCRLPGCLELVAFVTEAAA